MDGSRLRFIDLEKITLTFKSLTEQILQVGSFSQQNALDLAVLQNLYDDNVVLNQSVNGRLNQNIDIDTTFGNPNSSTLGISTYEFLSGSKLLYDKILPANSTSQYEVANLGTVKNLISSAASNVGF